MEKTILTINMTANSTQLVLVSGSRCAHLRSMERMLLQLLLHNIRSAKPVVATIVVVKVSSVQCCRQRLVLLKVKEMIRSSSTTVHSKSSDVGHRRGSDKISSAPVKEKRRTHIELMVGWNLIGIISLMLLLSDQISQLLLLKIGW